LYTYVGDISNIAHSIIKNNCLDYEVAIDATLGNGYDSDFLSSLFKKVISFEIQKTAIDNYNKHKKENVTIISDSHENILKHVKDKVDCVLYNLGYLPGGDKSITTKAETTIKSIEESLNLLKPGGIISISIYVGHEEGAKEKVKILEFVSKLPKNEYGVMLHTFVNRNNKAPMLLIIEKNQVAL
jgi:hypothetical protein